MSKAQIIRYKCCKVVFAACIEPECFTDKDWQDQVRKYVKRGDIVESVDSLEGITLSNCKCNPELL